MFHNYCDVPGRHSRSSIAVRRPGFATRFGARALGAFVRCILLLALPFAPARAAAQANGAGSETKPKADRELYQTASDALAQGRYAAATLPLQELHEKHPDFVLRDTVCAYLSECLIRQGKAEQGFQLLQELQTRLSSVSQTENAARAQPHAQPLDARLIKRVETLELYAARAAAADAEKQQRLSDAIKWLQLAATASPEEQASIRKDITRVGTKAAWQQLQTDGEPWPALGELSKISPILREQEAEILYAIAEKLTESKRTVLARPIYQQLSRRLPTQGAMPNWAHVVDLRLMQYSLQKKQYSECTRLFDLAKQRYGSVRLVEFQFLEAQAAIARIDFQTAIKLLREVERAAKDKDWTEHLAKAVWLQGEVSFLKRNYAEAIRSYEQVMLLPAKDWILRAELQRAKCLELSGQWKLALAAYEKIQVESPNSASRQLIKQRIAVLQESIPIQNR